MPRMKFSMSFWSMALIPITSLNDLSERIFFFLPIGLFEVLFAKVIEKSQK